MKKALSRFAPYREPAGRVRARFEAALDRFADRYIFILDSLSDSDAREIAFARPLGNFSEIEIEDDLRSVYTERENEVRIHHSLVAVDHEVGIDPVIESAVAFAYVACLRLCPI